MGGPNEKHPLRVGRISVRLFEKAFRQNSRDILGRTRTSKEWAAYMKEMRLLAIASRISARSNHSHYKLGCVIAKGGRVIGYGWNSTQTHPRSPSHHKTVHAEFMAILNLTEACRGATAYVSRYTKGGAWALARPCPGCYGMFARHGIKRIVYSVTSGFHKEAML